MAGRRLTGPRFPDDDGSAGGGGAGGAAELGALDGGSQALGGDSGTTEVDAPKANPEAGIGPDGSFDVLPDAPVSSLEPSIASPPWTEVPIPFLRTLRVSKIDDNNVAVTTFGNGAWKIPHP